MSEKVVGHVLPRIFLLQGVDFLMLQDLTVWLLFTVWPNGLWFVGYASSRKSSSPMLFAVASVVSRILQFFWRYMPSGRV
jgi:hypothetical protein